MDRRAYNQFCALATALDRVGERWTLLVIRELLVGPKRYSDLREGLPGIAANLLAQRLRTLEADGLIRKRRLPKPAASTVYELTDVGRDLEPALLALMRWGSGFMGRPTADQVVRTSWFGLALKALAGAEQLAGIEADYAVGPADEPIGLRLADGGIQVAEPPSDESDATLRADPRVLFRIAAGGSTLDDEIAAGRAALDNDGAGAAGTDETLADLRRLLRFPSRPAQLP